MKKKILVILNHSLYVRNFVATGLLNKLSQDYPNYELDVYVDAGSFKILPKNFPFKISPLPPKVLCGRFMGYFRQYLKEACLSARKNLNSTYTIKVKLKKAQNFKLWVYFHLMDFVNLFFNSEKIALAIEQEWIPIKRSAAEFIEEKKPDLVFFASLIHDQSKIIDLLKAARAKKIPIYSFVASWDNLTSKGPFLLNPDQLLVWGETHKNHALEEHGYNAQHVHVVGAPQFDPYFQEDKQYSRECFLKERGLDPSKKTILFVGTTKHKLADEPSILKELVRKINEPNSKLNNVQIWYRPHPRMIHDSTRGLRELPGIYFDDQSKRQQDSGEPGYSLHSEDIFHSSRILRSIDVVVSAFSTMIIEAALLGKPSVLIRFASDQEGLKDIIGTSQWKHLQEIGGWDFILTSTSMEDCVLKLAQLLDTDPSVYSGKLKAQAGLVVNNARSLAQNEIIKVLAQ